MTPLARLLPASTLALLYIVAPCAQAAEPAATLKFRFPEDHGAAPQANAVLAAPFVQAKTLDEAPVVDGVKDCEVSLKIFQGDRKDPTWVSQERCLKHQGQTLTAIDSQKYYLQGNNDYYHDKIPFHGICEDEQPEGQCLWNKIFRDAAPPTFVVTARTGAIGDFIALVRVFRNGELAFTWRPGTTAQKELVVSGAGLRERLEPFEAPIDIRFIPAGADVSGVDLTATVAAAQAPWATRVEAALKAIADDPGIAALLPDEQCLVFLTKSALAEAQRLSGKPVSAPVAGASGDCSAPTSDGSPIDYTKIRSVLVGEAKQANADVDAEIRAAGAKYGAAIAKELAKAKAAILEKAGDKKLPNNLSVTQSLATLDELAASATGAFDQAYQLVEKAHATAKELASDRERQAQDFAHVAATLDAQGSVFQPVHPNPGLAADEVALPMKYADPFQWFVLAPWHAVSVRLGRDSGLNDLSPANAIPVIDVVGCRWNGGSFKDIRLGAGALYFKDEVQTTDTAGATQTKDVYHAAGEMNVTLLGINLGVGVVIGESSYFPRFIDRTRIIVGVDIVRLLTGKPAELL
jgi:hypothetical protein